MRKISLCKGLSLCMGLSLFSISIKVDAKDIGDIATKTQRVMVDGFVINVPIEKTRASIVTKDPSKAALDQKKLDDEEDDDRGTPVNSQRKWNYIVIGNGNTGGVLARKLSDDFSKNVLVLEWGKNLVNDNEIQDPNVFAYANDLTYNQKYAVTTPVLTPELGLTTGQFIYVYSDGRTWGGSSAHNGLFAVRGTPEQYNKWASKTNDNRWLYSNVLPYMLGYENYTANGTTANLAQRGVGGEISITQSPVISSDTLAQAFARVAGTSIISDYNDPSLGDTGFSAHQQFITAGIGSHRSFSADYLPIGTVINKRGKGIDGRRLNIQSNALVSRIIFDGDKAVGVEYYQDGNPSVAQTVMLKNNDKNAIIIAAGANQSPAILQRSGIGDRQLLRSLGIKTIVNNPNVGAHLLNHYGPGATIGLQTTAFPFLHGYIDGRPFLPADGVRRMQVIGFGVFGVTAFSMSNMEPKSEGSVRIVSPNPTIYPEINLNMYSDGDETVPGSDLSNAVAFFKIAFDVAQAVAAPLYFPDPSHYPAPRGPALDDSLLAQDAKNLLGNGVIAYHNSGTCRMGKNINDSVVDSRCRVHGINRLRVGDLSVIPTINKGNTAYPGYLIGEVLAEDLLAS